MTKIRHPHHHARAGRAAYLAFVALLAPLACLALLCAVPAPALAKSYSIGDCEIAAKVARDGSLAVVVDQTFVFDGSFSFVYWDLPKRGAEAVEVISVAGPDGPMALAAGAEAGPGTYTISENASRVRVTAHFALEDTRAPFTLAYKATGAARRWSDTAELYWKFIGKDAWPVTMDRVAVVVTLPKGVKARQVRAWGHGPLSGSIRITDDARVRLAVSPLEAGAMVEGRVTFPAAALTQVTPRSEARMKEILAEEQRLAAQANEWRSQDWGPEGAPARRHDFRRDGLAAAALVAGFGLLVLLAIYLVYGREYRPRFRERYLREPPADLSPAVVDVLWNEGSLSSRAVTATLLDLIAQGEIAIESKSPSDGEVDSAGSWPFGKDKPDYVLRRPADHGEAGSASDRIMLSLIFAASTTRGVVTVDELREFARENPLPTAHRIFDWKEEVLGDAARAGIMEHYSERAVTMTRNFAYAGVAATILAAMVTFSPWALAALPVPIVMYRSRWRMRRRSREATELYAQYRALARYLRDFGRLDEKPPTAVALWEQYLVLACVFGIADEVSESLHLALPEFVEAPAVGAALTPLSAALSPGFRGALGGWAHHSVGGALAMSAAHMQDIDGGGFGGASGSGVGGFAKGGFGGGFSSGGGFGGGFSGGGGFGGGGGGGMGGGAG